MASITAIPFRIQRLALVAGVVTPITPVFTCSSVSIINSTTGDLKIITDGTGAEYGILPPIYERIIFLPQTGPTVSLFRGDTIAFWLQAANDGTVVLIWS